MNLAQQAGRSFLRARPLPGALRVLNNRCSVQQFRVDRSFANLPEPDAAARAHSAQVSQVLREQIAGAGGFLPFREWMNTALYAPGLGYYTAGAAKLGPGGDFVTAPELTPLFGRTLATDIATILAGAEGRHVLELGGGSGKLARDVLLGLDALGAPVDTYSILEVSADLAQRQRDTLQGDRRVRWLSALPDRIDGAIVMNEVLDAIPPDIVSRRGGEWFERGVAVHEGAFVWAERALADDALRSLAAARFPEGDDYYSEINRGAERLIGDMGRRLRSGAMLIIDYGFPACEYFHPQRDEGTLMAHYRHRASTDPFLWPGLSDLTAHVDFSAVAASAERAGLQLAGYTSQASYLVAAGLLEHLATVGEPTSPEFLREVSAVQKLTSPSEMGELFKVIALTRPGVTPLKGFGIRDHGWRLTRRST